MSAYGLDYLQFTESKKSKGRGGAIRRKQTTTVNVNKRITSPTYKLSIRVG